MGVAVIAARSCVYSEEGTLTVFCICLSVSYCKKVEVLLEDGLVIHV